MYEVIKLSLHSSFSYRGTTARATLDRNSIITNETRFRERTTSFLQYVVLLKCDVTVEQHSHVSLSSAVFCVFSLPNRYA